MSDLPADPVTGVEEGYALLDALLEVLAPPTRLDADGLPEWEGVLALDVAMSAMSRDDLIAVLLAMIERLSARPGPEEDAGPSELDDVMSWRLLVQLAEADRLRRARAVVTATSGRG